VRPVWRLGKAIAEPIPPLDRRDNTEALGLVLYTRCATTSTTGGLVLWLHDRDAIVMKLRHKPIVKLRTSTSVASHTADGDQDSEAEQTVWAGRFNA